MSNQAQIAAAEKFKAPEASSTTTKEVEQETKEVEAEESGDEEVCPLYPSSVYIITAFRLMKQVFRIKILAWSCSKPVCLEKLYVKMSLLSSDVFSYSRLSLLLRNMTMIL